MTVSGKTAAVRVVALDRAGLSLAQKHEERRDRSSQRRRVRDVSPLVFDVSGNPSLGLAESYEAHVAGVHRSKGARNIANHAILQFPTSIEINAATEARLLQDGVDFINATNGGRAVFHARLDRDEQGRHVVDVFFAPIYSKPTKSGPSEWVSLSKFLKENATLRYGSNSPQNQGRAYQDEFTEFLQQRWGNWVERGQRKVTIDPDRLEPEAYKLACDRADLDQRQQQIRVREQELANEEKTVTVLRARYNAANLQLNEKKHVDDLKDEAISLFFAGSIQSVEFDQEKASFAFSKDFEASHASSEFILRVGQFMHSVDRKSVV